MDIINLNKREDESDLSYHKRLVYGKLVDKTLSDVDYTQLSELLYGKPYATDVARRMMYGSCKTLQLVDNNILSRMDADMESEVNNKLIEIKKETQKFYDQRTAFNKVVRDESRRETLKEIVKRTIESTPGMVVKPLNKSDYHHIEKSDNDLLISLTDIHYGASHSNYWGKYSPEIFVEELDRYIKSIMKIADTHNSENCIVFQNGDAISGNIHKSIQVTNKENVLDQLKNVSEIIASFLIELSKRFKKVEYVSVSGNHSRIEKNKDDAIITERLDDLIGWYLKARLQKLDNIIIHDEDETRVDPTMYLIDIRGKTYCGVHGDFDPTQSKIQELKTMAAKPIYAVLSGHLHHNKIEDVQGIKAIMSGSFMGMDEYCVQKRIYGYPEQLVCVVDEDGVRCSYDIRLQ